MLRTSGSPISYQTVDIYRASQHYIDSRALYPPGFEKRGVGKDPKFRAIGPDGLARSTDDLRLRTNSSARRAGVFLQGSMRLLDNIPINAVDTEFSRPDIGCYPKNDEPLAIGVDSRRHYPDDQS